MGIFGKLFGSYSTKELARIEPIKKSVLDLEDKYSAMSDAELNLRLRISETDLKQVKHLT